MRSYGALIVLAMMLYLSGIVFGASKSGPLRLAALPESMNVMGSEQIVAGLASVQFKPITANQVTFPSTGSRWLRIQLAQDWNQRQEPILVIAHARFQPVTVYAPPDYRAQQLHHASPMHDERFSRHNLALALSESLLASEPIYLRLSAQTHPTTLTVSIQSARSYQATDTQWIRYTTFFESIQFTMVLVGLSLWLALRERLYGYFVGYLLPQLLYLLLISGDMYALPGGRLIAPMGIRALWFVASISTPFALSFIIEFCELRSVAPLFAKLLTWFRWPFILLAFTSAIPGPFVDSWQPEIGNILYLFTAIVAIISVTIAWYRGSTAAGIFLLAWIPQSLFTASRATQLLLHLPQPGWIEYGMLITFSLSSIVLTLGLSLSVIRAREERDRAQQLAERDALTGILNRRAMMGRLAESLTEARHLGTPLSLIFLDLDFFKGINDRYGHLAGDDCLRILTERITSELRPGDSLSRWGGEEFVVVLPNASQSEAEAVGERIRHRVQRDPFLAQSQSIEITVSLGISSYRGGPETPEQLIEQADSALYGAKKAGRNRLATYPVFAMVAR